MVRITRGQGSHPADRGAEIDFLIKRKLVNLNFRSRLSENGHVLHEVLQLTHVAAPGAGDQEVERIFAELRDCILWRAMATPEYAKEMIRERRNVFRPLAQRRGHHPKHREAGVKGLPPPPSPGPP